MRLGPRRAPQLCTLPQAASFARGHLSKIPLSPLGAPPLLLLRLFVLNGVPPPLNIQGKAAGLRLHLSAISWLLAPTSTPRPRRRRAEPPFPLHVLTSFPFPLHVLTSYQHMQPQPQPPRATAAAAAAAVLLIAYSYMPACQPADDAAAGRGVGSANPPPYLTPTALHPLPRLPLDLLALILGLLCLVGPMCSNCSCK